MLAPPRSLAGPRLRERRPALPSEFFFECVSEVIKDVSQHCPEALAHVDVGVEEVPDVTELWPPRVPLALAQEATMDQLARVVLYRRPIEFRCSSRPQVREMVFTTVVEQLSQVTGIPAEQIDPDYLPGSD
jgi:predicted Zn-dependent protease with MMP-like domain